VGLYVPLAGGEAPIRRAAVMALVLLVGELRGNRTDAWHALGLAGVVTLLADRSSAASLGWQLSFAAVAGMLALGRRLTSIFCARGVPQPLAEALAMTISATAATTPLLAWRERLYTYLTRPLLYWY
jgi:competence protein ComEC